MTVHSSADTVLVRTYRHEDAGDFLRLIDALAAYEQLPGPDAEAKARLVTDANAVPPRFEVRLAEIGGAVIGYAVFFMTYSTFVARPSLYLEDLFVQPDARGRGAGRSLFDACVAETKARGCGRMEWTVLDWNAPSIAFYQRQGARHQHDWQLYRLDGDALATHPAGR